MPPTTIGIIGTAGRGVGVKMTKSIFDAMLSKTEHIIEGQLKLEWEQVVLVSGGAAWSDHVAVQLFLLHDCGLTLFLPCAWDNKTPKFVDTGVTNWRSNPGRSANHYHQKFKLATGYEPLKDIQAAVYNGAIVDASHHGFHARNTAIARNSDVLIAFSWSTGNAPTEGGTFDTWRKCPAQRKIHISLHDLSGRSAVAKVKDMFHA
ncbi:hypothetical protein BC936DRAFT_144084 [Jimgerdemannia flammicorona]|uniref:Uncharacterized protein n=2 Tax=Jimgerdemannia flammicorona TaxID=994334 RepID=A0A433DD00_9FUNG|nr:hypothetical protein BC936DRAFT_144084 [Jimgerdemannia flammicorona]RUS24358.1 hypothetical protein BC938DRAFT_473703 [Jimgerdemannia flammicorona]